MASVYPRKTKGSDFSGKIQLNVTFLTSLSDNDKILKDVRQQYRQHGDARKCEIVGSVSYQKNARLVNVEFSLFANQHFNYPKEFFSKVRRDWCEVDSRGLQQPWLNTEEDQLYSYKGRRTPVHQDIDVQTMSFGAFKDRGTYGNHYESTNSDLKSIDLLLEHDRNSLTLMMRPGLQHTQSTCYPYKINLRYNDMEKFLLIEDTQQALVVYMPLKHPPQLSQADSDKIDGKTNWNRRLSFPGCSSDIIGKSSVIMFRITGRTSRDSVRRALSRIRSRFNFKIYYTPVRNWPCQPASADQTNKPRFVDFENNYALACLLSRGYMVTDRLDTFYKKVRSLSADYPTEVIAKAIYQLAIDIDSDRFIDLADKYEFLLEDFLKNGDDSNLPPTCRYVKRIMAMPTRLLFLQPEPMFENRVLRKYGEEHCLRIVFRDEGYSRLPTFAASEEISQRIISILDSGIDVGGRHYEFLACSNSQLRDHGCWLYAKDDQGNTAASIRKWMGDFSRIRCVATYISRMGQCFSTSEETVQVTVGKGTVHHIDDITAGEDPDGNQYCFSDGIGKISKPLVEKICKDLKKSVTPSAFQIRYGGCKGMVAMDTSLKGDVVKIRQSMYKFDSDHSNVEVMKATSPGRLYLNRQAITILSGLGVSDNSFLKLQDQMLSHLAKMFLLEDVAASSLSKRAQLGIKYKKVHGSGISLTTEPFFKALLQAVYKSFLGELRRRARIEIPPQYGRNMIGVLDETGTLQYGQVFVQYSKNVDEPQQSCLIRTGKVVVTKFPCHHPGDVRKFEAIDVPALHHMIDCIVFPSQGQRPHPNEMSGSDLDGDEYFVTWLPDLIFSGSNNSPMHFPAPIKKTLSRPVERSDMIEFVAEYIKNDRLGPMANAHLAMADQTKEGVFSDVCIKIAKLLSEAVDFAKTGHCPNLEKDQRPPKYPDFMGKQEKTIYQSKRVLGKLFRQCVAIEQVTVPKLVTSDDIIDDGNKDNPMLHVDKELLFEGYQQYVKDAEISRSRYEHQLSSLMAQYGIESEAEAISGCITKLSKRITERNERFDTEKIIRLKIKNLIEITRADFFAEFDGIDDDSEANDTHSTCIGPLKNHPNKDDMMLAKASAWYWVTYSHPNPSHISFPWVVSDLLAKIKLGSPTTVSCDPLMSDIRSQLCHHLIKDGKRLVYSYLNVDRISRKVKLYTVNYPCLLQVINVLLK